MDGVDICHIKLLVERMTYSGTIEPITRYTMRMMKVLYLEHRSKKVLKHF